MTHEGTSAPRSHKLRMVPLYLGAFMLLLVLYELYLAPLWEYTGFVA